MTFLRALSLSTLSMLLTSALSISSASAGLGGSDGGGGGAILCLNPNQSVKSVRLVDLVEASFYDKLTLSPGLASLSWQKQLAAAAERITFVDPDFRRNVKGYTDSMPKLLEQYLADTKNKDLYFPAPQDLSLGRTPPLSPGCQVVGAAVYSDGENVIQTQGLRLSHYIWKRLSNSDKAALLLHEAIYLAHRESHHLMGLPKVPSSAPTRVLVGLAFSTLLDNVSLIRTERARFEKSGDFQSLRLLFSYGEDRLQYPEANDRAGILRVKLVAALTPVLPYMVQQTSRPLYIAPKACAEGYRVEFTDDRNGPNDSDKRKCELRVESFSDLHPYGEPGDKGVLQAFDSAERNGEVTKYVYKYDPMLNFEPLDGEHGLPMRQKIALRCFKDPAVEDYTPEFQLLCGSRVLAQTEKSPGWDATWGKQVLPINSKINFSHR